MSKRYAIFCSGQGAQHASMFALTAQEPVQIVPAWDTTMLQRILSDPLEIFANGYAQPLIVAVGLTRWHALRARLPAPALIAGYSIGELTAYGVSGALDSTALVSVAGERAAAMDCCVDPSHPQAMLAVSGVMEEAVKIILQKYDLAIAIQNDVDRMVIGGLASQCALAETPLIAAGASCQRLPVAVASHTPLMKNAVARFAYALEQCHWSPLSAPVLAGVDAHKVRLPSQAVSALTAQLTETIRWNDCMDACVENGIEVVLEIGPGNALSRMMTARHPSLHCRSVDEFRSLQAVSDWVLQQIN